MEKITIHDKVFKPFIREEQIQERIEVLAEELNAKLGDKSPLFVIMLNGAFLFASELIKRFEGNCEVQFIRAKSYVGLKSSGNVDYSHTNDLNVEERHVVIIEDIVDSGKTLHDFQPILERKLPASISIVSLLVKPDALQYPVQVAHQGFEISNKFVVGYGLDYDELGRNLTSIYQLDEE